MKLNKIFENDTSTDNAPYESDEAKLKHLQAKQKVIEKKYYYFNNQYFLFPSGSPERQAMLDKRSAAWAKVTALKKEISSLKDGMDKFLKDSRVLQMTSGGVIKYYQTFTAPTGTKPSMYAKAHFKFTDNPKRAKNFEYTDHDNDQLRILQQHLNRLFPANMIFKVVVIKVRK